ncbi:MAG: filamentous hemagglutinin N-terminal domain-containing protein [Alphaproteobacteria bacterium]|nr:filamentous hemagglutinin N-terminal domain-containing protein [Alphaproteobacteria bacterium]
MYRSLRRRLDFLLVLTLSTILLLQPVLGSMAYAQTVIVPDVGAPAGNQPNVAESLNHTPVENIATPSSAGVSHNQLTDLQVGSEGLIVNNSASTANSALGSIVQGNANLASGHEATIILNEVTGTNTTGLNGSTEIVGKTAEYVVANPNGISCNGCGFINTPKVTPLPRALPS